MCDIIVIVNHYYYSNSNTAYDYFNVFEWRFEIEYLLTYGKEEEATVATGDGQNYMFNMVVNLFFF